MKRHVSRLLVAVFTLMAGAAFATPDRSTFSDDRLIAATQTHIYVLRSIEDNLGSYYSRLLDQHLIEIEIDTGEATRFWPLRRMRVDHLTQSDDQIPGQVTDRPGETHDMMSILRNLSAEPMQPRKWWMDGLEIRDGQVMLEDTLVLTNFGVRAAGRAQLGILRDAYPPLETAEEYVRLEKLDFYDLYGEGEWHCTLIQGAVLLRRAAGALRVAKLECEISGGAHFVSFHIFAPDDI